MGENNTPTAHKGCGVKKEWCLDINMVNKHLKLARDILNTVKERFQVYKFKKKFFFQLCDHQKMISSNIQIY